MGPYAMARGGGGCCPPMDLMPSEAMQLVQVIIPTESAHLAVSYLGDLGLLQFKDLNADKSPFQRMYAAQGFPQPDHAAEAAPMLLCARSLLRRGLALLRGCAEGECGREEALANAKRVATLVGLGGRGRRLGRCADPPPRVGADRLAGGWRSGAQTRCFLGCGDGEEGSVLSKVYEERRVMGYSREQMFAVVATVDLYEDFVPWCKRSRIIRRYDNGSFDAELEIGFKFLVESYMSHVEMEKPKYIKARGCSFLESLWLRPTISHFLSSSSENNSRSA